MEGILEPTKLAKVLTFRIEVFSFHYQETEITSSENLFQVMIVKFFKNLNRFFNFSSLNNL